MASSKQTGVFRQADEGTKLIKASNAFALELYTKLSTAKTGKNLFFSPASVIIALGMTSLGAKNNTEKQISDVLHFSDVAPEHLHTSLSDLQKALNSTSGDYILHTANRLYGHKSSEFMQTFLEATELHYGAKLEAVDFSTEAEKVRQEINAWVEKQTADKIKDLIPQGALNALTRLVLVNAIYFKGDWLEKFDKKRTTHGDFYIDESKTVKVPMMHLTKKFKLGWSHSLEAQALELPYKGNKLSMVIFLPTTKNGLASLEKKLTPEILYKVGQSFGMGPIKTVVSLPKFKLEDSFDLGGTLNDLGMSDLFDGGKADLSGIDGTKQLFVSKIVHKAFINVNEEGSEAAAATGGVIQKRSLPRIEQFNADHPFLFMIRENDTGSILFLGRMMRPKPSASSPSTDKSEL